MTTRTTTDSSRASAVPTGAPRLVVWRELPQAPARDAKAADAGQAQPREPWYDPAALYEEPERWDGLG